MESKISVVCDDDVAKIVLTGRVDATNAPALSDELRKLIGKPIKKIAFMVSELEYISSAGLRAIIFAKQKIGQNAQVFLIAPQPSVTDVIKMSGLDNFVSIQDSLSD